MCSRANNRHSCFLGKKGRLSNLKYVSFIPCYFMRLQPCLVIVEVWFSKTVFAPHLHLTWILWVPFSVLCTEPFRITSFAGQETLFLL